jgi:pyruvate dehydrogenase E1 component alpha subunit
VDYLQVLDENGTVDMSQFPKDLTDAKLVEMLKYMLFARALDAKALSLQRQGRAVTYAPLVGEEATQVGTASAMREQDTFIPNFRQHAVFLVRGLPLESFFIGWRGLVDTSEGAKKVKATAVAVPVASQVPHGLGIAFAMKYRSEGAAAIAYVGDGGTSEGDFYEALNMAGVWKVPLVVIIENNGWAISVPRKNQSAAKTLAQKGIAAGIKCVQVDGNDVIAVYKATSEAIANSVSGPTVIECVTYRMSMHTTADDPSRYRSDDEVAAWQKKDPIARVRVYLTNKGVWSEEGEKKYVEEQAKKIDEAVEIAEKYKSDPALMFQNVYSFMPDTLKEELDAAIAANFWQ